MSLAARLAAVIVVALLATLLVNTALFLAEWPFLPPPPPLSAMAAAVVRMFDAAGAAERPRLIASLLRTENEVVWHPDPPLPLAPADPSVDPQTNGMRRAVQAKLGDPPRPVIIGPGPGIHLEVQLTDGSWLALRTPAWNPPPPRWTGLALRLAMAGAVIGAISLWAARRLSEPLTEFARAAERFGRDTDAAALPERGPEELRRTIHVSTPCRTVCGALSTTVRGCSRQCRMICVRL